MPEVGWVKFIDKVKPSILMAGLSANGYEAMNLTTRDKLVWENIFEMKEIASNSNMLKPNQRLKFDQLHHGHAVEGAQMAVHLDDSKNVKLVHGYVVKNFTNPEAIVNISPEEAITIALNEINAELYAWEDPGWEQQIKQDLGDSSATHYPKPDLIYINSGNGRNDANYVLTFSVNVHSLKPDSSQKIYVDVLSGRIVRKTNNGKSIRPPSTFLGSNATGTVETLYNGNRSLSTYNRGWPYNDYVLKDFTRGDKIHTLNYSSTAWNLRSEIDDNNNYWETLDVPATLHWTVGASWDYFSNAHGRNGLDNNGSEIRVEANYSGWDLYERKDGRDYIRDGVTENGNHWTSPESTGHEFTHGVIKHAVDFAESGEPLFLEESFCDIFGVMVERSVKGSIDWIIGNDANFPLRNLSQTNDPNVLYPGADYYWGIRWIYPYTLDGVEYMNAGPQNFWFYLLANGGSGTNNEGFNSYSVSGIGIDQAARITYRNLTTYMLRGSNYYDARVGAILAAEDLYGTCSNQYLQTMNAWYAVGVGSPAGSCGTPLSGSISGPDYLNMYQQGSYTMNASGGTGTYSYSWQKSYDNGSTWYSFGSNTKTVTHAPFDSSSPSDQVEIRCTVTSGIQSEKYYKGTYCMDCYGGLRTLEVETYPNPAVNDLNYVLEGKQILPVELKLINIHGQLALKKVSYRHHGTLNIKSLPRGFYILMISKNNQILKRKSIILNK